LTEEAAEKAAAIAVEKATPLSMNAYKIPIARTLIKRSLLAAVS
jgi:CO/xanthine dehydrogenase FAD-binding subunit